MTGISPNPQAWRSRPPGLRVAHGPAGRRPADTGWALPESPIFALAETAAARWPQAVLVACPGRRVTYAEGIAAARALAGALVATAPGAVAVVLRDDCDIAIALFACLGAGRTALVVNAFHPVERIAAILDDGAPALVLADPSLVLPQGRGWQVRHGVGVAPGEAAVPLPAAMAPDGPALVFYTSGSTGRPRGFVRSQAQLVLRAHRRIADMAVDSSDHVLSLVPLSVGTAVTWLVTALVAGAGFGVANPASLGLGGLGAEVAVQRPTVLSVVPSLMRLLIAVPQVRDVLAPTRMVDTISEVLTQTDVAAWRRALSSDCHIMASFGMTEANGIAGWFLPPDLAHLPERLPVGHGRSGYEVAVVDASGQAVADGETGTLWVRGGLISPAEWQGGHCVAGRARPDPHDLSRLVLCGNDLVRRDSDGLLHFVGRADDMVKVRGNRVEPAEVEAALRRLPGVADAVVLAERRGEAAKLRGFVVPAPGGPADWAAVLHLLRPVVPSFMVPAQGAVLPALPRLPNGKVDRGRLLAGG